MLDEIGVRHIVFCQQSDGKCHFEGDPSFHYLKVPAPLTRIHFIQQSCPHSRQPLTSNTPFSSRSECGASTSLTPTMPLHWSTSIHSSPSFAPTSTQATTCSSTASLGPTAPGQPASHASCTFATSTNTPLPHLRSASGRPLTPSAPSRLYLSTLTTPSAQWATSKMAHLVLQMMESPLERR